MTLIDGHWKLNWSKRPFEYLMIKSPSLWYSDWRSKLNSRRVHVKDRLQVPICEPVEVDDDGDNFGRQRINGTDRIFVRWTLLATPCKHRPHALMELYCRIYTVPALLLTFVCFTLGTISKDFIRHNMPDGCHASKYHSVWTYTVFNLVSLIQFGFE